MSNTDEMDVEINAYLDACERHSADFFAALDGDDVAAARLPSLTVPDLAVKLWFAGCEKYGLAWTYREYDLRQARNKV